MFPLVTALPVAETFHEGTVFLMRRKFLASAAASVALLAGAFVFGSQTGNSPLPDVRVVDKLARCAQILDSEACIIEVANAALRAGAVPELIAASDALQRSDTNFQIDCHGAYHAFGPDAIEFYGSAAEAIRNLSYPVCKGGFAHGILESFATAYGPLKDWADIVTVCIDLLSSDGRRGGECGHGLGHGLVLESPGVTPESLLERCNFLTATRDREGLGKPVAEHCAFGVMMGIYAPLDGDMVQIAEPASLVDSCAYYSDLPHILNGCMGGVGYSLGENLRFYTQDPPRGIDLMVGACQANPAADIAHGRLRTVESCLSNLLLVAYSATRSTVDDYVTLCQQLESLHSRRISAACLYEARGGLSEADHERMMSIDPDLRADALIWSNRGN